MDVEGGENANGDGALPIKNSSILAIASEECVRLRAVTLTTEHHEGIKTEQLPRPDERSLPEDWTLPGLRWTDKLFPPEWFHGNEVDDDEKTFELPLMTSHRKERILWLSQSLLAQSPFRIGKTRHERLRDYSVASNKYYIDGSVASLPVEAFPDSGAGACFISPEMASNLSLSLTPNTRKTFYLANNKPSQSPGMVQVPWMFAGEDEQHSLNCWILPGCIHDIVLGNHFLNLTKTLTKFMHRVKCKLSLSERPRLRLIGKQIQRLTGYLNGEMALAIPDTGSDLMCMSGSYARSMGLSIDDNVDNLLEVELADGSVCITSGVVRNLSWAVGDKAILCDFYVLEDLCADVVLGKDYLFDLGVFSNCSDSFIDIDLTEDIVHFCGVHLIGKHSSALNILEEEYLADRE
ncbi:hypothetical protein J7T55_006956 [Diaporthe amygdali]|uniref:uncharacterized protein n=1 Tax=Phomopsis amygdali TaxID=1214568 RepID=UPI0022FE1214|nr:uncharacterized protein J7T55_006956 [Diaporthe amygdali]KAJ0107077.1 hypothetical protein J7T55_006956 [Diaporthe amygdali]